VYTKVDFSISQNTKIYAKLKLISQNFVQTILQNFAEFRRKMLRNFVKSMLPKINGKIHIKDIVENLFHETFFFFIPFP
jgi:hypothetical protein